MKTFLRWGLIVGGISVIVFIIGNFFFHFWPLYPIWGWKFHYFGPRMMIGFPFIGLLLIAVMGLILVRTLFQSSSIPSRSRNKELFFCPHCGRDLRHGESTSGGKQ